MRFIHRVWHLPVFLLIVSLIHEAQAQKPPQPPHFIKKMDKEVELQFGPINRFVLECIAHAEPLPMYTWFKNEIKLENNTAGISLISNLEHSQLEFSSPAPEHEGFYHCEAENDLGKAKSTVVHVTSQISKPAKGTSAPVFIRAPESELPSVGNTAKFECIAEGKPDPEIVWTKNGEVLPGETGNKLVLHNIGPGDVANYACNASNIAGYEYKDVYLNILTLPATITEGPRDQVVSKGSNVTIKCKTEGFPLPTISWFLNDEPIQGSDRLKINNISGDLSIVNATVEDAGTYMCEAKNHGTMSKVGSLVVKSKTEIISGPSDLYVEVFSSVTMNCTVVSDLSEELTVIWKKNNVDLGQSIYGENQRISQDEKYSLVIKNITLADEGTYTCVAFTDSTASNPATDSGLLIVSGIPPVLAPLPTIPHQLEGGDINLECEVTQGYQSPQISWFKNGLPITSEDNVKINHGTLSIKKSVPMNSGEYSCKAVNDWGTDIKGTKIWIRKRTQILSQPVYVEYSAGNGVMLDCNVEVDANLRNSLNINWFKGEEMLRVSTVSLVPLENNIMYDVAEEEETRFMMHQNNSLQILNLQEEDLGFYKCQASTELEQVLRSEPSQIYLAANFPYWIIILILVCLIAVMILIICVWRVRKRNRGKGYYGVKDVEKNGGKHNKSDIYYNTEDVDSIMNEQDNNPNTSTPIFTPKTIRHLSNTEKSVGSVSSLIENEDERLARGMDEDGSFRERYSD